MCRGFRSARPNGGRDGRVDIVSSESWYEAPNWTKHPLRTIPFTNNYVDNFSDLPIDVDNDGCVDVVQIGYFARRIVWIRKCGEPVAVAPREDVEDDRGPALIVLLPARRRDDEAPLEPRGRCAHALPFVPGEARQLRAADRSGLEQRLGDVPLDGRELLVSEVGRLPAPPSASRTR